jgi:chaperonin GroEL
MAKMVQFQEEALRSILRGVSAIAQAVAVTLGPQGREVMIVQEGGAISLTKDRGRIIRKIVLQDRFESMGAELVKEACFKLEEGRGVAVVLTEAIYAEGVKAVVLGANPGAMKRGIDKAVLEICHQLDAMAKAKQVEEFQWDEGYFSPYFVTNPEKMTVEMDSPAIFLTDKKLSSVQEVITLLEKRHKSLLMVVGGVERAVLSTLVVNKVKANFSLCVVKAPSREVMEKLIALTGATAFSDSTYLGRAKRVEVGKNKTVVFPAIKGEGVVAGGGVAFLRAAAKLKKVAFPEEEQIGLECVLKACFAPALHIANNCGQSGDLIAEKVYRRRGGWGWNAHTDEFADLIKEQIVDPVRVVKSSLRSAASVAGMLLNVSVLVTGYNSS